MECYSCFNIAAVNFVIYNRLPKLNECLCMYCERDVPLTTLTDNAEENLERFFGMRHLAMIHGLSADAEEQDFPCAKCDFYVKRDWQFSAYISYINLSAYPSPCQCRCFYCGVYKNPVNSFENLKKPEVAAMYENAFNTLKFAKKIGAVTKYTHWQVSCGEIAIHPYKKELFDLVRGEPATFFTNAFMFDAGIAKELHDNPMTKINLSIDSGTPETWHKVKGVDNFYHVLDNLAAYRKASQRAGQITLKYIVCPGINDSEEDFLAFVDIVKFLDVQSVTISKDTGEGRFSEKTLESAARLLAICKFNGIAQTALGDTYIAGERKYCYSLASKILECMVQNY